MTPRLTYSLFMFLALGVFLLARHFMPKPAALAALSWRNRVALSLGAFIGGALGAKLPFTLAGGTWFADGKTLTTGLAGAYLAVELTKLTLGVRVKTGDTFALPLALALAVGRWGCFFNGCCYGTETTLPWGVDFGDGLRRHPTQVYESLFHLTMAAVLWGTMTWDVFRYQRLKLYLITYCAYRFATEFIRPEPAWCLGLTFYQWASLGLATALSVQWLFDRRLLLRESDWAPDGGADESLKMSLSSTDRGPSASPAPLTAKDQI